MGKKHKQRPISIISRNHWAEWLKPMTWNRVVGGAYRRARYGITWCDAWSLDGYLAAVTANGCRYLRGNAYGHPRDITYDEWMAILDDIIEGMDAFVDAQYNYDEAAREKYDRAVELVSEWRGHLWD